MTSSANSNSVPSRCHSRSLSKSKSKRKHKRKSKRKSKSRSHHSERTKFVLIGPPATVSECRPLIERLVPRGFELVVILIIPGQSIDYQGAVGSPSTVVAHFVAIDTQESDKVELQMCFETIGAMGELEAILPTTYMVVKVDLVICQQRQCAVEVCSRIFFGELMATVWPRRLSICGSRYLVGTTDQLYADFADLIPSLLLPKSRSRIRPNDEAASDRAISVPIPVRSPKQVRFRVPLEIKN